VTDVTGATERRRPIRLPLIAIVVFVFGAAGLPGPSDRVEIVDTTSATYTFTCILHREGIAAPGVGVLTPVPQSAASH